MAWLVDVPIEEFIREEEWGPDGPPKKGILSHAEPRFTKNDVPVRVTLDRDISDCARFVLAIGGGEWIVSQRFKDLVESLEPGVNNFLATELVFSKGAPAKEPYHFLQHGQDLDSIALDRSDHKEIDRYDGSKAFLLNFKNHSVVMDKSKTKGCHLWKEKKASYRDFFLSNELFGKIKELGYRDCFQPLICDEVFL
ncbi:imm11 family protein [Labrenzia sp. PHM005]|uniref:imm11 family protein n=1 Tax=Labrenzia sp. PHM005 TaxID=2590016 RepID=UPI00113FE97F|nr:DUF1629 domain-containing protein [Labrenzia sp. PHM005]QDG75254.1 hypothetical protein FJ695_04895 [Labrenzia sp. PHM005]